MKEPKFIVVALTASVWSGYKGCKIIPFGSIYPAIYSQVFGPASQEECESFADNSCSEAGPRAVRSAEDIKEKLDKVAERTEQCVKDVRDADTMRERVEAVEKCLHDIKEIAREGVF